MVDEKNIPILPEHFLEQTVDSDRTVVQGVRNLTAPVENREPCLMAISGSTTGQLFKLTGEVMHIGRTKDCEIFLDDDGVSRKHSRLEISPNGIVTIVDLNSTNGTYFNGMRIQRHVLRDGDKIQIGSTTILKFQYQDSLEASFQESQYRSATRDRLTGIFNKMHFWEKFSKEFTWAQRHDETLSLIVFDIDHFKKVNDTHGHPAGDMVLCELTRVVARGMRHDDIFARWGGEEFAIFLREVDEKRAYVLAERIRRMVEVNKFKWEDKRVYVTISLGVATLFQGTFGTPDEMFKVADDYLYKAKRDGRNRVASAVRC